MSLRQVFTDRGSYVKTNGEGNIYNFTLKNFVYLNLCILTTWSYLFTLFATEGSIPNFISKNTLEGRKQNKYCPQKEVLFV